MDGLKGHSALNGLGAYDEGFRDALEGPLADIVACAVLLRYELCGGNVAEAARSLGISRSRAHQVMRDSGRDPRQEG